MFCTFMHYFRHPNVPTALIKYNFSYLIKKSFQKHPKIWTSKLKLLMKFAKSEKRKEVNIICSVVLYEVSCACVSVCVPLLGKIYVLKSLIIILFVNELKTIKIFFIIT